MARPKKVESASDGKEIKIDFGFCLDLFNYQANLLQIQKDNAHKAVTIASANLSHAQNLLQNLKDQVGYVALTNEIKTETLVDKYPHIHRLLLAENAAETDTTGLPDAQIPTTGDVKPPKPKKQRKERDPNAPKRPLTAYFLFLQDKKDETGAALRKENPDGFKPGDVQKRNTELWNALPEHEQDPYKKRYEANLEQYKKDLAVYKAQGGEIGPDDEVKDEDEVVGGTASNQPALAPVEAEEEDEEDEEEEANVPESKDESEESEEVSPPPKKESKRPAAKATKEASPEKKKKRGAPVKEDKKAKKGKEPTKSASPELPKRKRKAEEKEPAKPETKKKKPRKSQGYQGNDEDF